MTNDTTAPEWIWIESQAEETAEGYGSWDCRNVYDYDLEYVRADALEAAQTRIAELEGALTGSLAVITDYLEYEHDGDPWSEDARTMGEMEINEYERSGRLKEAREILEGKG